MSLRAVAGWRPIGAGSFNLNKWLSNQGAAAQQDVSLNNAANSAFATAQANYFQNLANLTENQVLKRVQAEVKAKQAELKKLLSGVGSNVNTVA